MTSAPAPALELATIQKLRKVAVGVALLGLIALSVVSQSIGGVGGRWHEPVEAIGLAGIVLSIIGRAWCTLYIGGRKSMDSQGWLVVSVGQQRAARSHTGSA